MIVKIFLQVQKMNRIRCREKLVLLGVLLTFNLFSQSLERTSLVKDSLMLLSSFDLDNHRRVREAYNGLSDVFVLDFTKACSREAPAKVSQKVANVVRYAEYIDYSNIEVIQSLLSVQPKVLTVHLPFRGKVLIIDLVQVDLFGDGFSVETNDRKDVNVDLGLYYQGVVRGEKSLVGMNFFKDEFNAFISNDSSVDKVIEVGLIPMTNESRNIHIIYSDNDLLTLDRSFNCASDDQRNNSEDVDPLPQQKLLLNSSANSTYRCVRYLWETRYNVYQAKGNNLQSVTNFMTSLFNNFQLLYNNEQIGSKLVKLKIWTVQDPYSDQLEAYSAIPTDFITSEYTADLATLFSASMTAGSSGGGTIGGRGWVNGICSPDNAQKKAICVGILGGEVTVVPNYSWPVFTASHEVGHNLGSRHTHACVWDVNQDGVFDEAIDGCFHHEGTCLDAPIPSNGGTIMSYCHRNAVGVNFSLGFGTLPGNLIREKVYSCATISCDAMGVVGAVNGCLYNYEPNGSKSKAFQLTSDIPVYAGIQEAGDEDFYKICTAKTSTLEINLHKPEGSQFYFLVYDAYGNIINSSSTSSTNDVLTLLNQPPGTYYIKVKSQGNSYNSNMCYWLKATVVTNTDCKLDYEPNQDKLTAWPISIGDNIIATNFPQGDVDAYVFNVPYSNVGNDYIINLTSSELTNLMVEDEESYYIETSTGLNSHRIILSAHYAGDYYIFVQRTNTVTSVDCYTLSISNDNGACIDPHLSCDYAYEPNNVINQASIIVPGQPISAALLGQWDLDYYKLILNSPQTVTFNLYRPGSGNLDLYIQNSFGEDISAGNTSGTSTESVLLHDLPAGVYYIEIYGEENDISSNCYTLLINYEAPSCPAANEPNETFANAVRLTSGEKVTGAISQVGDVDFYKTSITSLSNITFCLAPPNGINLDFYVYNGNGVLLGTGTGLSTLKTSTLYNQPAGTYYLKVVGANGAMSASCYTITSQVRPICDVTYEPNETPVSAAILNVGEIVSGAIPTIGDIDWFKLTTTSLTNTILNLIGPAEVNLDVYVYSANNIGVPISSGIGLTGLETVSLSNLPAGTYYIKIVGVNGGSSSLCYSLRTESIVTGCQNAYEPNATLSSAVSIPISSSISAAITPSGDIDCYYVWMPQSGTYTFNLSGPSGVDYDVYIYNSAGWYLGSGTGFTSNEIVTITIPSAGTYLIKVYGYAGANSVNCYTLSVSKATKSQTINDNDPNKNIYTLFPNPVLDKLSIYSSQKEENFQFEVIDTKGNMLFKQYALGMAELNVSSLSAGVYFVRVMSDDNEQTLLKFVKE